MEERAATPDLIHEKLVIESDVYLQSSEAYNRFIVHTEHLLDKLLTKKMEDGTDESGDFEKVQAFKKKKTQKSYQDYLEYKRGDKAIELWENSTQDGVLKLVVADHDHYTEADQKRYDGLIILLNTDSYFSSLNNTDGKTTTIILPKHK